LHFLRQFSEFHHDIPCERWLRSLINRIDPGLVWALLYELGGVAVARAP
jgi:hypothetical protein